MRQIKFRGKRLDNGEWAYGYFTKNHESGTCYITTQTKNGGAHPYKVDPETVGQYTGQQYNTGLDIYEGDVVQYPDAFMNGSENGDWEEIGSIGVIKWDDEQAQFYVTNRESIDMSDFWEQIDEAEALGNIHDNPELLEVEKS